MSDEYMEQTLLEREREVSSFISELELHDFFEILEAKLNAIAQLNIKNTV